MVLITAAMGLMAFTGIVHSGSLHTVGTRKEREKVTRFNVNS